MPPRLDVPLVAAPSLPGWIGPLDVVVIVGDDAGDMALADAASRAHRRHAEFVVVAPIGTARRCGGRARPGPVAAGRRARAVPLRRPRRCADRRLPGTGTGAPSAVTSTWRHSPTPSTPRRPGTTVPRCLRRPRENPCRALSRLCASVLRRQSGQDALAQRARPARCSPSAVCAAAPSTSPLR